MVVYQKVSDLSTKGSYSIISQPPALGLLVFRLRLAWVVEANALQIFDRIRAL